jgi:formylglycine-generating enzyme
MIHDVTLQDLADAKMKQEVQSQLISVLKPVFETVNHSEDAFGLPTLRHTVTSSIFKFIPAGEFVMGMSEKEEAAARRIRDPFNANIDEMRPTVNVAIKAFLMSSTPVTTILFNKFSEKQATGYQKDVYPVNVSFENAMRFAHAMRCSLPTETQWEYACRATTRTLFTWGDELLPRGDLDKWLRIRFAEGYQGKLNSNKFGLFGLFTGEWCQDEYRKNYAVDAQILTGEHVIRGGGSRFWPWQANEWIWCISAMRMPERDLFQDRCAGFRLVYEL